MKERLAGWPHLIPWLCAKDLAGRGGDAAQEVAVTLGLPAFAKRPVGHSSAGARVLPTLDAVRTTLMEADGEDLIERFVEGEMFHVDSVQMRGETAWLGAGRYFESCVKTLSGAALGSVSPAADMPLLAELGAVHEGALAYLGRPDGAIHMDVFRGGDGRWWFCEIAARPAGLVIPKVYESNRGIDLRASHYRAALGLADPLVRTPRAASFAAWWTPLKVHASLIECLRVPPLRSCTLTWWQPETIARRERVEGAAHSCWLAGLPTTPAGGRSGEARSAPPGARPMAPRLHRPGRRAPRPV